MSHWFVAVIHLCVCVCVLSAIMCPTLTSVTNAAVWTYSNTQAFGSTATTSCSSGFALSGGALSLTCGGTSSTGSWTGTAPICSGAPSRCGEQARRHGRDDFACVVYPLCFDGWSPQSLWVVCFTSLVHLATFPIQRADSARACLGGFRCAC